MIKEAEQYAEQDRKRREEVEKLNNADAICYQAEKTLADFGDKLTEDLRKRIETAMHATREAHTKRDATLAAERAAALQSVLQEVGKVLYAQTQPASGDTTTGPSASAAPGEAHPTGAGPQGRVVDAEYTTMPPR